ncbi:MAG: biopolymer transporter ExbD [Victivallales bacterium]
MARFKTRLKIFKGMPDLTPFINVVFLLLLFFMLSSSFVQISGIKINVPQTTEGENETGAEKLIISVDKTNRFFFNDEPLESDWRKLKDKLQLFTSKSNARTVVIVADKDTSYGEIVKLMSLARSMNLNVYAATVPEAKKEQITEDAPAE